MKAWYDDIDSATLQRIKTYSAFNDAMSKNLMVQTMYEYREKEVQDFKETNHELAETCIARKNRIAELEKENAELEKENKELKTVKIPQLERRIASIRGAHSVDCRKLNARTEQVERLKKENAELKADFLKACKVKEQGFREAEQALECKDKQLTKAKSLLKQFLTHYENKTIYVENMSDLLSDTEQFLSEVEK